MTSLKSSSELKAIARTQLIGNYMTTSLSILLLYFINLLVSDLITSFCNIKTISGMILAMIISLIFSIFMGVFGFGLAHMFLGLSCKQQIHTSNIYYGFRTNLNQNLIVSLRLIATVFIPIFIGILSVGITNKSNHFAIVTIGYLILAAGIIYGVFKGLQYSMVFFISLDFPNYDTKKVFKMSEYLMKGNMGRLFYLIVSFLPLYLLSFLTIPLGTFFTIGLLWIAPYMLATLTNFYLNLVKSLSNQ